ncbi:hypothetical protein AAF712_002235 [Marasmius tenuissimus]|uniref:Uncharacterized protein n=1 Tax=Marasmius tenuissimus TaxID=585030 RepID=A0ABR3ABM6_9AGAR
MSEASAYATRTLRNRKEFGGMKADVAEIILDNFDTSALLRHRQHEQAEQEGLIDDQPILQEYSRPKPCQSKPAILTPLIQLANPLTLPSFIPPASLPKPAVFIPDPSKTSKQNKNAKRRSVWRDGRRSVRVVVQEQVGTTLKACAIRKAARTLLDKKTHLTIPKSLTECLAQRKGGSWTGRKVVRNGKTYTLDEVLSLPGMQSIEWDGKETVVIRGPDGGRATTLLEIPDDPTWIGESENFLELLDWAEEEIKQRKLNLKGRRGDYSSIPTGISFGGGQTAPGNFAQSDVEQEIWEKVYAHPFYQRVLRYANHGMKVYYPKLERLYTNVKDKLRVDNPSLSDPLPGCCFSACNLNLGRAVTLRHTDFLNLLFGQCAVLALGDFEYKKGGHLVLWDLGLVIEFPPGAMILLPSALLEHSNVSIAGDERRSSITFYSASGLFRWVTNGYMSDKEFKARASTKMRQRWDQHRANLWKVGVDLLSK